MNDRRELRTSSYTIYVDLPWTSDDVLLIHGYSGAHDVVDAGVARFLRSRDRTPVPKPLYGAWRPERLAETVEVPGDEITRHLERRGFLTTLTPGEELARFESVVDVLATKHRNNQPIFIVMPTYGCNLRCGYCFQDHMRTDPRYGHLLQVMRPDVFDRILNAMDEIDRGGNTQRLITLFGGEPLLRENRAIVDHIVTSAAKRKATIFHAITNGTELNAYRDLLNPEQIAWVQITLDGIPSAHDGRRVHADGGGSFEAIARNISMCLQQGIEVSVRINVDRGNVDGLPQLARELRARGWVGQRGFSAAVSAVTGSSGAADKRDLFTSWSLTKRLAALADEHTEMSTLLGPSSGTAADLLDVFSGRESPYSMLRETFCGAQRSMHVFDSFGDVYACWERTGDPEHRIGWVDEHGALRLRGDDRPTVTARRSLPLFKAGPTTQAEWKRRNVKVNDTCARCRYALHCGGGCAISALEIGGDFYGNHCDGFQSTFRAAAAQAYRAFLDGARTGQRAHTVCGA